MQLTPFVSIQPDSKCKSTAAPPLSYKIHTIHWNISWNQYNPSQEPSNQDKFAIWYCLGNISRVQKHCYHVFWTITLHVTSKSQFIGKMMNPFLELKIQRRWPHTKISHFLNYNEPTFHIVPKERMTHIHHVASCKSVLIDPQQHDQTNATLKLDDMTRRKVRDIDQLACKMQDPLHNCWYQLQQS